MSDIMRPIPFAQLMDWVLTEHKTQGTIFGVCKLPVHANGQARPIFREKIEAPFGPAAGPNTQLSQNIIAAYAGGSRFFELKTVQIMDGEELSKCVSKPCITAKDECYNCEWSTELTVPQAYDEYVKAWVALKVIAKEFALGDPDAFVFNMSVGYDLKGIQSPKIDRYIEGMKDASGSAVWQECISWLKGNLDLFSRVDGAFVAAIPSRVSDSITVSTLHGCPPDEIERIASYLITEKHLNTYVKCNPTLLGYEFARKTLDSLGYDYIAFDDHHFKEDLQWADAVPMFRRLTALCAERGLEFGLKLTNTFPVDVAAGELPSSEMYMSGRSLFPLTLSLAQKITSEFDGALRISYSGGADLHSIKKLYNAGIWPITIATYLLKPGGYNRQDQLAQELMDCGSGYFTGVDTEALTKLCERALSDPYYRKPVKPLPDRKLKRKVPLTDCFTAPCRGGCPIEQDIPAYLRLVGEGKYEEALEVITRRNALPFITGTICSHRCMDKCVRNYYEESVRIRDAKLMAANGGFAALLPRLKPAEKRSGVHVAVVGGGPAGLSAAYFLGREGVPVTVFEREASLGGVVRHVIPEFRIDSAAIDNDVALVSAMGGEFRCGEEVQSASALKAQGFTHVILACGAWKAGDAGLKYGEAMGVIKFLKDAKRDPASLRLGSHVVVIGGGNTAMDAARAAKRIPGVTDVSLVYRRTKRYMPADEEELAMALEDGVSFRELLAPIGVKDGVLTCGVMELGAPDASGRRSPVDTGRTVEVPADTVISAVGELVDRELLERSGIAVDGKGRAAVDENMATSVPGVYAVGDARRGPATVVEAIADAAKAAQAIVSFSLDQFASLNVNPDPEAPRAKKGVFIPQSEVAGPGRRCLECATVCECCVDVCPNRANLSIRVPGKCMPQIIHVDGMCNECGNCATFCPYDSRPYRDKFTLFWSDEDLLNSENEGFLPLSGGRAMVRLDGGVFETDVTDPACVLPGDLRDLILAVETDYPYLLSGCRHG